MDSRVSATGLKSVELDELTTNQIIIIWSVVISSNSTDFKPVAETLLSIIIKYRYIFYNSFINFFL